MNIEQEVIETIRQHYLNCSGKPSPLRALKDRYGQGFKFESLGLGKFNQWLRKNADKFQVEKSVCEFIRDVSKELIEEEDLILSIQKFFDQSEMFSHRRYVLTYLRKIYGNGSFSDFGFGTFHTFLERHNMDMGIAKQEDFKNQQEWNEWSGRRI